MVKYLYGLLRSVQKRMTLDVLKCTNSRKYVIHSSRRLGKTFELVILSSIKCYEKPNAQVRYASVTQKAVRKMVHPIFKIVFKPVKEKYKPKWNSLEGAYIFPNESETHIAGVNNGNADDLRGTGADLCVVDEAAFVDDLEYLITSVLLPQVIDTGGMIIMASSSPRSPAHEFTKYILEARQGGYYSSFNIYESDYSPEIIEEFCREAGGKNSTAWRREFLNEIVVDTSYAIIPESDKLKVGLERVRLRDQYRNYVAMDIGIKDLTVVLFGYYDFKRATLCIEREFVINGPDMTTDKLAAGIAAIELSLFKQEPHVRVADNNNLLLLNDLATKHDCPFIATNKDSLEAMINAVRILIIQERLEIDHSCTVLIDSIKFGFWTESRRDWGRSSVLGHFDALAALMYLVRNLDLEDNPIDVPAKSERRGYTIQEDLVADGFDDDLEFNEPEF